jgi:hypothetical protein
MTATQSTDITALFRTQTADMPTISTLTEKPSYPSLRKFQDAINENAMAVSSYQTDLGHLVLVISDPQFLNVNNNTAFVPPPNPGASPTDPTATIVAGTRETTATAIATLPFTAAEAIRQFTQQQSDYIRYKSTNIALKNQILNSVADKYICHLKHTITRYAAITPLQLLTHLWTTYGTIDQSDQTANEKRMRTQWNPPEVIESLFEQLQEGQDFAKQGSETISYDQLVRWGYENIFATGLFDHDCKKWRKQPVIDKTWPLFKTFFTLAEEDRAKHATTSEATYTANQVQDLIQQELSSFLDRTAKEYTPQDEPAASTIPPESANAVTAADIKKMIDAAVNQQAPPVRRQMQDKTNLRDGRRGGRKRKEPLIAQALLEGVPVTYCWTHGITSNLNHTSKACTRKSEGHKDDATYDQKMGGNEHRVTPRT